MGEHIVDKLIELKAVMDFLDKRIESGIITAVINLCQKQDISDLPELNAFIGQLT